MVVLASPVYLIVDVEAVNVPVMTKGAPPARERVMVLLEASKIVLVEIVKVYLTSKSPPAVKVLPVLVMVKL